jgi:archaellum biogenesis ATPase FlaH
MDHCDPDRSETLVITEGQIDSLSVVEAYGGNINAVSVPTGAKGFTWVPYCWDFLCQYQTLIVFGDYEHDHITLLDEMRSRFHGTVKHVRPENYLDCKDANEILLKHGAEAVRAAVETAVIVENPKIKKLADVESKDMSQMEGIGTGLPTLDRTLGGFYFGQLCIVTGERGLGKSTLTSQFIAHAIRQGVCAFCYSGELPEWYFQDWFDRQVAGRQRINAKVSENGYTNYLVDGTCLDQIHKWYDELCYIYDNSTIDEDIDENEALIDVLEAAIKQYGCRILLVDNLMTALEDDLKSDIYRQQTQFVRKLAQLAKQYNVIILLIVHPRKTINGEYFRNDDVAGSSNITNLADVVLRYAKPKNDPDNPDSDPADRILQITKNRLNGRLNFDGIKLWYEDESKRISESHFFNWPMGWESHPEGAPEGFTDDNTDEIPF